MAYGSPLYILSLLSVFGITAALYFLFHKRSERCQRTVIFVLMLVNTTQHFAKSWIYPQHRGEGFTIVSTAYNMCAVLIIFLPLVLVLKSRFLKNFFFYVGAIAGVLAIAVPFWFIGKPAEELGWEYVRFYLCHVLLHTTAVLPLLLGLHKPSYKEFWQVGLCFLAALCLILLNNVIFISLGLCPGADPNDLYTAMLVHGPCAMMGPPESMLWLGELAKWFTLPAFVGANPMGRYAPILWYAVPLYLGVSMIAFAIFAVADRKQLLYDLRNNTH